MQPRKYLGLAVDCTVIEMHCGEVWARGNFGEDVWFDFILPIKEDA